MWHVYMTHFRLSCRTAKFRLVLCAYFCGNEYCYRQVFQLAKYLVRYIFMPKDSKVIKSIYHMARTIYTIILLIFKRHFNFMNVCISVSVESPMHMCFRITFPTLAGRHNNPRIEINGKHINMRRSWPRQLQREREVFVQAEQQSVLPGDDAR